MNPSVKRLLGTVLLIATVGLATVLAARQSLAVERPPSLALSVHPQPLSGTLNHG